MVSMLEVFALNQKMRGVNAVMLKVSGKVMRSSIFWDVIQHRLVVIDVSGHPIGPIYRVKAVQGEWTS
jgi:hypothetical protein